MLDDPKPGESEPVEPAESGGAPETAEDKQEDAGDFITRQVLEKDSVFFEG